LVTVQIDKVQNIHWQYNRFPGAGSYYKGWPLEIFKALSFNFVSSSEC